MHRIQSHILRQLMERSPRRYSELRPREVEGNVFMYHLSRVIGLGFVEKISDGYALTPAGGRYVDGLSSADFQPRIQPKIVTDIVCRNEAGEWLVFERSRQPFAGLIGFPSGKVHLGEAIAEAARRELLDKTGFSADVKHRGDIYVTTYRGDWVENHVLVHVFSGIITGGGLKEKSELGSAYWQHIRDPRAPEYFRGFAEIIEHLESDTGRFFAEYTFRL